MLDIKRIQELGSTCKHVCYPLYQDCYGNEWDGHGPIPEWLNLYLAGGMNLDEFFMPRNVRIH